jgi:cholesterol transport system auxiliary component
VTSSPSIRWIALAALCLSLGGCVTLFPKSVPAQLYQFNVVPPAQPATPGAMVSVLRAPTNFVRGAESDMILTSTGDQMAYIAAARWISPASALFDQAESDAFDGYATRARLARRGEIVSAPVSLRLDVETFEARYLNGPGAAPVVVVKVHAVLIRTADRTILATQTFDSQKPAAENRVGAIVPAFDAALTDVLKQVVSWTDQQMAS